MFKFSPRGIILTLFVINVSLSFCQSEADKKRAWHWYFGENAGLDFSSGSPVPDLSGTCYAEEACFTISDTSGSLLFYGEPDTIWNKNHQMMVNGDLGIVGNPTQMQCVPQPGNDSLFYVFHVLSGPPFTLYYSIIDINANGGLGEVISKNNALAPTNVTEGIGAVQHCNGTDIWITNKVLGTKSILAWQLTTTGVISTPVVSSNVVQVEYTENVGTNFNFSPDGTIAAVSFLNGTPSNWPDSDFELYQFDNCTGLFTNSIRIPFECAYGACFSPNNSKLYLGSAQDCLFDPSYTGKLIQYDVSVYDSATIVSSAYELRSGGYYSSSDMRIAPDGKIYVCDLDTNRWDYGFYDLGVIENPNASGAACNYMSDTIDLGGKAHFLGLPEYVAYYFDEPVFIEEVQDELKPDIYPNPFTEHLSIQCHKVGKYEISIYSFDGKLLLTRIMISSLTMYNVELPPGMYFLRVTDLYNSQYTITQKIIKL